MVWVSWSAWVEFGSAAVSVVSISITRSAICFIWPMALFDDMLLECVGST